ncbi:ATP-binding protein [Candidatus Parabeggiatoa sp. HSG14]|uniref:ATP-binding protein n=1 Tax=Candidatus Parabeggiatoa sp. HSG14 TaxID=3055593 RepID=UPI0025A8BA0A|nr:ATP-binding protein [Thiotrichales bacterium HSG14]
MPEEQTLKKVDLLSEVKHLRQQVAILSKEKAHLQISLEAVAEHDDAFERHLLETCKSAEELSKAQLLLDVKELSRQVTTLTKEKTHLEISLETIAEHSDVFENQLVEVHDLLETEVAKRTQELAEKNNLLQQEIQERKRIETILRESEKYNRTLIKEALIGLALTHMDGCLVEVNPAFANIIGYSVEEAVKLNFWEFTPEKKTKLEWLHQLKIAGRCGPCETDYLHKQGHRVPVRLSGLIVPHNGERFIWTNVADITEHKKAETALRLAKESAEQAKTMAERANRAKTAFLANMSHELRTPLNAIIGYSDMLREEASDMEDDEIIGCLENIETAGKQLLNIISDILDVTKIEAEKMDMALKEFDVAILVKEVVTLIQPTLQGDYLKIECPQEIGHMYGDATKLQQILQNLLSNAAKFTICGTITLNVSRTAELFTFLVIDTGIGISPEKLEEIFDPFTQADSSSTRQYGGTGLGLTICHQLCQKMGGHITVKSELGKGSVFTVQLPCHVKS